MASRTVLTEGPREVQVIPAAPERDPADELLRARTGGRRIGQLALRDAPVSETLRMFAELGRFNVVFASDAADRRVTLTLRDVSVASAFRSVLSVAELGADVVGGEVLEVHARRR